jgi:hypothetical protein
MKSLIRGAIVVLALGAALASHQPVANAQRESIQPTWVLTVPSAWGEYTGSSHDFGLAFQDHDGTLRFIRELACEIPGLQRLPHPYLEVRRK